MPEPNVAIRPSALADAGRPLAHRLAAMAGKMGDLLARIAPQTDGDNRREFLAAVGGQYLDEAGTQAPAHDSGVEALIRLTDAFVLSAIDLDLIVLAGLADEHEGFCHVLRTLHPRGEPRPTVALATQLLCRTHGERRELAARMRQGAVVTSGCLRVSPEGPAPEQSLLPAEALWPLLRGVDLWPAALDVLDGSAAPSIEDAFLDQPAMRQARALLAKGVRATLLVLGDDEDVAFEWGVALARAEGLEPRTIGWPLAPPAELERSLRVHTAARGGVPVLKISVTDDPSAAPALTLTDLPGPAIVCARLGFAPVRGARAVYPLTVERPRAVARRKMWSAVLPQIGDRAVAVAERYALGPHLAAEVAMDVRMRADVSRHPIGLDEIADSVRVRSAVPLASGVTLVRPTASWRHLVLRPAREQQLREAVSRLHEQSRVLDKWKFLKDRPGRRGVRVLFVGPPGTGKTLSAEVLANELGVDLLIADVSRLVSKWIGETPKNLGRIFDMAERSTAVILFDEADALFGKRTEVTDAHDRYANLETAYLLSRLDRFEGMAILGTNLRQNIDTAFLRRLEFIVDFEEPDASERERLWKCHVPDRRLLAKEVSLPELAAAYPLTGALIRNAATAAAFLAASDKSLITRRHLAHALRREYEKSGRAFPGHLPEPVR